MYVSIYIYTVIKDFQRLVLSVASTLRMYSNQPPPSHQDPIHIGKGIVLERMMILILERGIYVAVLC